MKIKFERNEAPYGLYYYKTNMENWPRKEEEGDLGDCGSQQQWEALSTSNLRTM